METFLKIMLGVAIASIVFVTVETFTTSGLEKAYQEVYANWEKKCAEDGGVIIMTSPTRTDCFKDGQIINKWN